MVNYGAAFKLPFSNWGRFAALFLLAFVTSGMSVSTSVISSLSKNALVGVALKLLLVELALFVVTIFFSLITMGYTLRIVRSAAQGKNVLPSFDNFFSMIVPGLKYFLASLIYSIPFIIFIVIGAALVIWSIASHSSGAAVIGIVISVPIFLAWLIFAAYIQPMLMTHFAHENRFSAFFELRRCFKYAFTSAYFVPWLAAFGYSIAFFIPYFIIIMPLSLLTTATPLAALLTVPISALYSTILAPTVSNLYGQAYHDIRAGESGKAAVGRLHVVRKK